MDVFGSTDNKLRTGYPFTHPKMIFSPLEIMFSLDLSFIQNIFIDFGNFLPLIFFTEVGNLL